jgi:cysteine desulfurase
MAKRAYFDWNATAPLRPEARAAMAAALDVCGNPSSVHAEGRAARRLVEAARERVAALVGAQPREVVFTAGGTEANALALSPALGDLLLVSAIEHPSVLAGGRFAAVEQVPVGTDGVVDLAALQRMLAGRSRPLVSVMLANNETGAIQPVADAAKRVHAAGGLLHVDAVQAPGKITCQFKELNADLMTISSHKIGGPQGVGALIRGDGLELAPLLRGGSQERGARAGTENVAAIAGFGAAAEAARTGLAEAAARMAALRDRIEAGLRAATPGIAVFSADSPRLPNTTLFSAPGMKAETAVIAFDLEGVAVSSGAACSSGKVAPSHVLAAMGVPPDLARGAIRLSLGHATSENEIGLLLKAWAKVAEERMPAVQETIERVRRIDVDQYKYGFVTDIESEKAPKGLIRGHRPLHFGQEERARVDADLAARRLPALAHHARADLGARRLSEDRLPGSLLLLGAEEERAGRSRSTRSIRKFCDLREARHPAARAGRCWPASKSGRTARTATAGLRSTRCSTRSRSRPPSRRS